MSGSRLFRTTGVWLLILGLAGCQGDDAAQDGESVQARVLRQLSDAEPGDHIELPAGHFSFTEPLILASEGLTLEGAGRDLTRLSFKSQTAASASVQLNADAISVLDLSIEDAPHTAIQMTEVRLAQLRDVGVNWTDRESAAPVGIWAADSRRLLLDDLSVSGARESGVLIQRSRDITVRNSRINNNLIGIDIRNSQRSDVYDNSVIDNSLGVRVDNALDATVSGFAIRLFDNDILRNNRDNTAPESSALASLWRGVGIQIDGSDAVEIFDNRFSENSTADVYVRKATADEATTQAAVLDAYPESIHIHDNQYGDGGTQPESFKLKWLRWTQFGLGSRLPPVLWDGEFDPDKQLNGDTPVHLRLCVPDVAAPVLNLDQAHDFANPSVSTDWHKCSLPSLPGVQIDWE